jgi:hypothetical protein
MQPDPEQRYGKRGCDSEPCAYTPRGSSASLCKTANHLVRRPCDQEAKGGENKGDSKQFEPFMRAANGTTIRIHALAHDAHERGWRTGNEPKNGGR